MDSIRILKGLCEDSMRIRKGFHRLLKNKNREDSIRILEIDKASMRKR